MREWLAEQRVFISSAMGDTAVDRRTVAEVVEGLGARAVWFEEFGRDADAEEAYLTEVDASTIYLGILKELYGRPNPPDGDAATDVEYRRARAGGKRVSVYIAANAPHRERALARFIDRIRFSVTTENYSTLDDLDRRVRRRLKELAAEALAPWIKVGEFVFRADEITDSGGTIMIRARVSDEIAHHFQALRDRQIGRERLRFVSRTRVADAELSGVETTTRAGSGDELTIRLANIQPPQGHAMRSGTRGYSADELLELGVRALFLGETIPERIGMLSFMVDPGINIDEVRQAFNLPNEFAEAVVRLIVSEGLVSSGNAERVASLTLGPRTSQSRHITIAWVDARTYANVEPTQRHIEGEWRV